MGKMFHEDNIVATQELAMGIVATQELAMGIVATQELTMATEMFQEDNIVVTQKMAMGGDMLNEDNVGLTQDILDMESLAGLNQSLTVFAASGNESCWSQESTASMMKIDSGQNHRNQMGMRQNHGQMGEAGQDHASTMVHDSATDGSFIARAWCL